MKGMVIKPNIKNLIRQLNRAKLCLNQYLLPCYKPVTDSFNSNDLKRWVVF
jgi:hypothetical protein